MEQEKQLRKSLKSHAEDLERVIASKVSKEELISAQEAVDKERQLCSLLQTKVSEFELNLKEMEAGHVLATEQLENERKLKLNLESDVKALQVRVRKQELMWHLFLFFTFIVFFFFF